MLVEHAHLSPAAKYPKIFLDATAEVNDPRLWQLAAAATACATVRLVGAYGLYRQRAWVEVLAALCGAIMPIVQSICARWTALFLARGAQGGFIGP